MERERPEYLPPIERRRWYFPWLVTGFLTVISLATVGVLTLGRTNSAWSERFEGLRRTAAAAEPAAPAPAKPQREFVAAPVVTPSRARPKQLGREWPLMVAGCFLRTTAARDQSHKSEAGLIRRRFGERAQRALPNCNQSAPVRRGGGRLCLARARHRRPRRSPYVLGS